MNDSLKISNIQFKSFLTGDVCNNVFS